MPITTIPSHTTQGQSGLQTGLAGNANDKSMATNRADLERHTRVPILAEVNRGGTEFLPPVDWFRAES